MNSEEKTIEDLENEFPRLAAGAFLKAREQTLAAGYSVVEAEAGVVYEVFPNGTRKVVKRIEPPVTMPLGTTILLR